MWGGFFMNANAEVVFSQTDYSTSSTTGPTRYWYGTQKLGTLSKNVQLTYVTVYGKWNIESLDPLYTGIIKIYEPNHFGQNDYVVGEFYRYWTQSDIDLNFTTRKVTYYATTSPVNLYAGNDYGLGIDGNPYEFFGSPTHDESRCTYANNSFCVGDFGIFYYEIGYNFTNIEITYPYNGYSGDIFPAWWLTINDEEVIATSTNKTVCVNYGIVFDSTTNSTDCDTIPGNATGTIQWNMPSENLKYIASTTPQLFWAQATYLVGTSSAYVSDIINFTVSGTCEDIINCAFNKFGTSTNYVSALSSSDTRCKTVEGVWVIGGLCHMFVELFIPTNYSIIQIQDLKNRWYNSAPLSLWQDFQIFYDRMASSSTASSSITINPSFDFNLGRGTTTISITININPQTIVNEFPKITVITYYVTLILEFIWIFILGKFLIKRIP